MKDIIMTLFALALLTGCSKVNGTNPSSNKALSSVAGTQVKKKEGFMQQTLDDWIKDEWTPAVEKNKAIKKKNEDSSRDFTLQEYVEKIEIYLKETKNDSAQGSHTQKVISMPVIGDN